MTLSLIFFPSSTNVFASSEYFLSCVSCWSVRTGFPLFAHVRTSCKSANPSNPGVERSHVGTNHVPISPVATSPVVSVIHVKSDPVSATVPVAKSKSSIHPVVPTIVDSHPNIPITFAFMF